MSEVNQQQAKLLKKTTATPKPIVAKAAISKPVISKAVVSKPVMAKAANKPVAVKVTAPKVEKVAKPAKEKTPKLKMERDSFTMPKTEYAQFSVLKERLNKLGQPAKKGELIRAGIAQLTAMTDAALKSALSKVPTLTTGRPSHK
jgi:hypothetical protein